MSLFNLKIMKKIFNKIPTISILLLIMLGSCNKDFLNKSPLDQLDAATFYASKADVDMALTACYSTLQDGQFTWGSPYLDCLSDNATCNNAATLDNYNSVELARGPITPTTGGFVTSIYTTAYIYIARYNIFLQTLAAYKGSDLSAAQNTEYQAEARLLRAMKYFDLYRFYGSVPLVTTPLTIKTEYQAKADSSAVLAQINADIVFAVANLPDVSYASNGGHLVKAAAELLQARVLLVDSYDAGGNAIASVMQQVETVTSDIMSKGYSIAPSFRGLFCQDLGQQNGNPEFIFAVNFLGPTDYPEPLGGAANGTWLSNSTWGESAVLLAEQGSLFPLVNFANEFEFKDGTPFSTSNPLYNPANVYQNRDPRMSKTLFTDSIVFENGFHDVGFSPTATGYDLYKEIESSDAANIYNTTNGSAWPMMRYAEVLLSYAEAANETDGPTAAVYSAINQIRNRADINMPPLPAGLSQTQMRAAIRHERRVELAFEGFRYDDLKRWKIAETALTMPASAGVISRSFQTINYNFPLPQTEIDINHGVLVQNPNY